MALTAFAPAKVNLYLHLIGRRPDGYHLLDSLIAFADIGDRITAEPATTLSLEITGPEAAGLADLGQDNLVLRAARLLVAHTGTARGAALSLEKNLPIAAGIGGGSSDAAAALRLLTALWQLSIGEEALRILGARLGADLPACLYRRAAWLGGVGERIEPASDLPEAGILLASPRKQLPTAAVFAARTGPFYEAGRFAPMPRDAAGLARTLTALRNDLTDAAIGIVPEIAAVLARLSRLPGALLARMSGSGATCFALFPDRGAAEEARAALAAAEPQWWCAAGGLVGGETVAGQALEFPVRREITGKNRFRIGVISK
jgi:4-diphosphocytidyl-2-C-methyl-D-erythritol kinase